MADVPAAEGQADTTNHMNHMNHQYLDFLLKVFIAVPPPPKKKRKGEGDPAPVWITDKKAAEKAGMTIRYELADLGRRGFMYATPDGAYYDGVLDPLTADDVHRLVAIGAVALPPKPVEAPPVAKPEEHPVVPVVSQRVTVTFTVDHGLDVAEIDRIRSLPAVTAWRRLQNSAFDVQAESVTIE